MRGSLHGVDFCDLFCYQCDCAMKHPCPLFEYSAPAYFKMLNCFGYGIIFNESLVKGAWKDHVVISQDDYGANAKFFIYNWEVPH